MSRATPPTSTAAIKELLQKGLDLYGGGNHEDAIRCWLQVLQLDPRNELARDYLESAGYENPQPVASGEVPAQVIDLHPAQARRRAKAEGLDSRADTPPPSSAHVTEDGELSDPELRRLMTERRWEDALRLLYAARAEAPRDLAISRSIRLLRNKLSQIYSNQLHNLDRVPQLTTAGRQEVLASEERLVALLVDGISNFGDIVRASSLGKVATLRILCSFQDNEIIASFPPSMVPPQPSGARLAGDNQQAVEGERTASNVPPYQPPSQGEASSGSVRPAGSSATRSPKGPPLGAPAGRPDSPHSQPNTGMDASEPTSARTQAALKYEALFTQATQAYLIRDFSRAVELFEQCTRLNPDDSRPQHNLRAIQKRIGKQ